MISPGGATYTDSQIRHVHIPGEIQTNIIPLHLNCACSREK